MHRALQMSVLMSFVLCFVGGQLLASLQLQLSVSLCVIICWLPLLYVLLLFALLSLSHAGAAQVLVPPASISAEHLISSGIPPISSPAVTSLQQDRQLLQELLRLA